MEDNARFLEQIEDKISSLDGYFTISIEENGVLLTVYPRQGEGKPVRTPKIIESLEERGITKIDNAFLVHVVKEASGNPVKIAEKPEEIEPNIYVLVSRNRMEATLQVIMPKGCRPVSMDEIMDKLQNAGITYGIDNASVQIALNQPGSTVVCAKGSAAVNGVNASILYYNDLDSKGRPVELEDGRVDFKNINMFITVQKDDLLAAKILPTSGTAGIDVLGNIVPAKPGKDLVLPKGKNVYVVDGLKLYAEQAGHLDIFNNKVNVIPVIEVKGDVDLSTGNIEFIGSVVVKGSVQTGFAVKAEGNVEIAGNVTGGIVEGKNVTVRMGIQGKQQGYITATENVVTKYIENATVYAGKDIVSDVIMHSKVSAAKRIVVQERRGLIVGGQTSAGEEIRAKIIGTISASKTSIEVGVNPKLREEYQELRKELKKAELNLEQSQKALNLLKAMDQRTMPPNKYEMLLKLTKARFHLMGQAQTMQNRIAEIEISLEEMRYGCIKVSEIMYPGVNLVIGTLVKPIRDLVRFANFFAEDGEIKIGSYT